MSVPTLILDTNILVSAFRSSLGASHRLVGLIDTGLFDIGLTAPLVLEYEAVCKRFGSAEFTSDDVDRFIDSLCRIGKLSVIHFHVRPGLADPDDNLVLEAAIASASSWIVTFNLRDLAAGSARYGIEAMRPVDALKRLGVTR